MKKILVSLLGATIIIGGAATYTFAHSNESFNVNDHHRFNYEEMKPYIQEMHPNWSSQEQREMFEFCH
ncbi:hypothetical protein BN1058_01631 [Paraliobacillus sp. PM-2]|uniref:hypothetical protein n=1 Tax=Paraliobacillus sp. PM-2 TaxID=1462524 RepID=UPI00061C12D3|nr:hypothetical protein [Paraliobacillus sp. PM-2]CQR47322.1 hypothetical protein BN1058_01631 [Paraliobacillus sp. PM-2]